MKWKQQKAHGEATVKLIGTGQRFKSLFADLRMNGDVSEVYKDSFALSNAVFVEAKRIVTIIAFVKILLQLPSNERAVTAKALLLKDLTGVPEFLVKDLEAVRDARATTRQRKS